MTEEEMRNTVYPISEIFTSPQGEGVWAGTMMTFIRLAGCCVGKPYPKSRERDSPYMQLPIYTEECTLYDGRKFPCDTDYRVKERLTVEQILQQVKVQTVCITGGEPFIHNLIPLVWTLQHIGVNVNIETSGTVPLSKAFPFGEDGIPHPLSETVWITVSPKKGVLDTMLAAANEIKLLVDEKFNCEAIPEKALNKIVFIQPVNDEWKVRPENIQRCLELQKKNPTWRLSLQLHKVLSDYIGEKVR